MLYDLIEMFPAFKAEWESDETYCKEDDGSYSYHGLFAEFGHYFQDHFAEMSEGKIHEFCGYIETFVRDDEVHEIVDNAICTCFLENVYGKPFDTELPKYLFPNSRKFYVRWHGL